MRSARVWLRRVLAVLRSRTHAAAERIVTCATTATVAVVAVATACPGGVCRGGMPTQGGNGRAGVGRAMLLVVLVK